MKLNTNAHSVFSLYYRLILVVKYRCQAFVDGISSCVREIFEYVVSSYKIEWVERRRK